MAAPRNARIEQILAALVGFPDGLSAREIAEATFIEPDDSPLDKRRAIAKVNSHLTRLIDRGLIERRTFHASPNRYVLDGKALQPVYLSMRELNLIIHVFDALLKRHLIGEPCRVVLNRLEAERRRIESAKPEAKK